MVALCNLQSPLSCFMHSYPNVPRLGIVFLFTDEPGDVFAWNVGSSTCSTAVFDLVASCSVSYAKDAGSRGDAQTRGGQYMLCPSATHYSFVFSSACLLACLLGQAVSAYMFVQEQARAEEVLW